MLCIVLTVLIYAAMCGGTRLLYLIKVVTCNKMSTCHFFKFRNFRSAPFIRVRTSCAEAAAARRIDRARNVALEDDSLALACCHRVSDRNCRNQAARIRMQTVHSQLVAVRKLNHSTQIHYDDPVRNVLYDRQVVGNEQIGKSHLILQIFEHVDDLSLNGNV